ncbi:MAG TPA: hypothetical protein DFR83_05710 [Deltaproteobacteria bacterium]|nr:hypothetical protein [Deltaproteobacteria bacterium]
MPPAILVRGETCGDATEAGLDLGLGLNIFHEIEPDKVPRCDMIYGPQGGWHSDFAIRVWGIDPSGDWKLDLQATIGGEVVGQSVFVPRLECLEPGHPMVNVGIRLFWLEEATMLHGQEAEIAARLHDEREEEHLDDVRVQLIDLDFGADDTGAP